MDALKKQLTTLVFRAVFGAVNWVLDKLEDHANQDID